MAIENLKKYMTFYSSFLLFYIAAAPGFPFLPWLPVRDVTKATTLRTALCVCVCARDGVLELMLQALQAHTGHGSVATGPLSSAPLRRL